MDIALSPSDLIALKAATRDLVRAVSGLERAAMLTGKSVSVIQRWYSTTDDPDQTRGAMIDVVSAAILERDLAEAGDARRPVTDCLARLNGRSLQDAAGSAARDTVASASTKLITTGSELHLTLIDALADGVVTKTEAVAADRSAAKHVEALIELRGTLASVLGS